MATTREVLEYIIKIQGDDPSLRKLANQLDSLESQIDRIQSRAGRGYVEVNTAAGNDLRARHLQKTHQASREIASSFLGTTNARDLRGYKDVGYLEAVRGTLLGDSQFSGDEGARRTANAINTRINQLNRERERKLERENQKIQESIDARDRETRKRLQLMAEQDRQIAEIRQGNRQVLNEAQYIGNSNQRIGDYYRGLNQSVDSLYALRKYAHAITGNERNVGKGIDSILPENEFNDLFGHLSVMQNGGLGYLSPYQQAELARITQALGIRGFTPNGLGSVSKAPSGLGKASSGAFGGLSNFAKFAGVGALRGLGYTAALLGPSLALGGAYAGANALTSLARGSLQSYGEIESQQLFLGGSLANFFNFGRGISNAQNLTYARNYAENRLVPQIRETAIQSPLTYQELFEGFSRSSPVLFGKGLNVQEALQLTNRIYSVGKAGGLKPASIADDIRALNTGNYRNAQTFQFAGVSQEEFKELAKKRGTELVTALNEIFAPFDETIKEYENTYEGKMARLSDSFFTLQVAIGEGLAPAIADFSDKISELILEAKKSGTLEAFTNGLKGITSFITDSFVPAMQNVDKFLGKVLGVAMDISTYGLIDTASNVGRFFGLDTTVIDKIRGARDNFAENGALGGLGTAITDYGRVLGAIDKQQASQKQEADIYNRAKAITERRLANDATDFSMKTGRYSNGQTRNERKAQYMAEETAKIRASIALQNNPESKGKGAGLGDSDKDSKTNRVLPRETEPFKDFSNFDNQLLSLNEQKVGLSFQQSTNSQAIDKAVGLSAFSNARNYLKNQLSLYEQDANIQSQIIEIEKMKDAFQYGVYKAPEDYGAPEDQPLLPVLVNGTVQLPSLFGSETAGDTIIRNGVGIGRSGSTLSGSIGSKSTQILGTSVESTAIRAKNRVTQDQNKKLEDIAKFEAGERQRQLQLLQIQTDLQLKRIDIQEKLNAIDDQEFQQKVALKNAFTNISLDARASAFNATNRDKYQASLAQSQTTVDQASANLRRLGRKLMDEEGYTPFSLFGNTQFLSGLAEVQRAKSAVQTLIRNELFANGERNFTKFESAFVGVLNRAGSNPLTTLTGLDNAGRSRIGFLEARNKSLRSLGGDAFDAQIQANLREIQSLQEGLADRQFQVGVAQDSAKYQRQQSLRRQDFTNQLEVSSRLRITEAQSALSGLDAKSALNSLATATDPALKNLYNKYNTSGTLTPEQFNNFRAELKGIIASSSDALDQIGVAKTNATFRLNNRQTDFLSFLNGGTGTPSVEEQLQRKLTSIQNSVNANILGEGVSFDLRRQVEFEKQSRPLRSQYVKDLATYQLRSGGSAAYSAILQGQDPFVAFSSAVPDPLNLGNSFQSIFSKSASAGQKGIATQNLAAGLGTYLVGQISPNSYNNEFSTLGGAIGTALGGPAGAALGSIGGALFGGLFKKKSGPDPEDEARKQFQNKLIDLVSGINKSLQQAPDFFRAFSREAILGSPSRHYGGRAYSDLNLQYNRGSI